MTLLDKLLPLSRYWRNITLTPVICHKAYKYFTISALLLVLLLVMNLSMIVENVYAIEGKRKRKFYMYSKMTPKRLTYGEKELHQNSNSDCL